MTADTSTTPPDDLLLAQFDYDLPPDRIAQEPARPRDASRLMVLDRAGGGVAHHHFYDLPQLLRPGDLLVMNDTRVIPAAFTARRRTGSRIEGIFLRVLEATGRWEVLLAGRGRLREGETLDMVDAAARPRAEFTLMGRGDGGVWHVQPPAGTDVLEVLGRVGRMPLPPYIRREDQDGRAPADAADYQTMYARADGAVAAPTAGLHFTPRVMEALAARGIERTFVTLHVGMGTFQPVRAERLAEHVMHEEFVEIGDAAAAAINRARAEGRRIVAVGTTTVRALESAAAQESRGGSPHPPRLLAPARLWTRLFIHPPYKFQVVDALVTNFHLPRTTLLVMVAALVGRERILDAYRQAIEAGYRFYSYGDAMLII